jgi:hypothetical protein
MKFRWILTTAILFLSVLSASVLLAQGNRVVQFDGSTDYVNIGDSSDLVMTDAFTIEAWIFPTGTNQSGGIIVNKEGEYEIARFPSGTIQFVIANSNPGWTRWIDSGYVAPLHTWTHIAWTYSAKDTTLKIFANGNQVFSTSGTGNIGDRHPSEDETRIGGRQRDPQFFDGLIDAVRIWNIARTQEEIKATMNITLSGDDPGLVGYWNFDDGTAKDLSPFGNHGELKGDAKIVESDLAIAPIFVQPQSIIPQTVNESFTWGIEVATSADLHDFTFDLAFDPTILQVDGVDPGSFLSDAGTNPVTCETAQIDNTTGRITGISCRRNGVDGISGFGMLTKIAFEAIGVGESALRIENATFAAPDGSPIDFTTRDSTVTVFGPHGRITGHVVDFEGESVRGVEVVALEADTTVGISGATDLHGNYEIENITEAGDVIVQARVPGLVPGTAYAAVQIGETTPHVNLILRQPALSDSVVDEEGFIRNWLLLGSIPWDNDANRLITDQLAVKDRAQFPQPQEPATKALLPIEGTYGEGLAETHRWRLYMDDDRDIDLKALYGSVKAVTYAFTQIKSPRDSEVALLLGSDDGVMVWLNDKLAHLNGTAGSRNVDEETVQTYYTEPTVKLRLRKGWNRLLIKIENQGDDWGFLARFANADGTPITDLDVSPEPTPLLVGLKLAKLQPGAISAVNIVAMPITAMILLRFF